MRQGGDEGLARKYYDQLSEHPRFSVSNKQRVCVWEQLGHGRTSKAMGFVKLRRRAHVHVHLVQFTVLGY